MRTRSPSVAPKWQAGTDDALAAASTSDNESGVHEMRIREAASPNSAASQRSGIAAVNSSEATNPVEPLPPNLASPKTHDSANATANPSVRTIVGG